MGNYLDKTYAAVDGVLLSYAGNDVSLKLPGRLANMEIHTIGDGAVMESGGLQQVVVPAGVKRIGKNSFSSCGSLTNVYIPYTVTAYSENAFKNCPKLENLYIYGLELSERRYKELKASSARVNGSVYLAHSFPHIRRAKDAVSTTDAGPANYIQNGIKRLFTSQNPAEENGAASLYRSLDGFSFDKEDQYTTETSEFMKLLSDENAYYSDAVSEEKNDQFLRSEKYPPIEKTAVFTFDDSKTRTEHGKYVITAAIKFGYHFWQSKVPVVVYGNTYYIYRRHYLSCGPGLNYLRRDAAIFSERGIISDKREAREIYAKYKLLSIL